MPEQLSNEEAAPARSEVDGSGAAFHGNIILRYVVSPVKGIKNCNKKW